MELTSSDYWDSWWSSSSMAIARDDDPQYGERGYFLKAIENRFGPLAGKSVVELGGCSSYRLMSLAKFRRMLATAIDYSEVGIERSKKFFQAYGCNVELICSDFFSPALNDRRF